MRNLKSVIVKKESIRISIFFTRLSEFTMQTKCLVQDVIQKLSLTTATHDVEVNETITALAHMVQGTKPFYRWVSFVFYLSLFILFGQVDESFNAPDRSLFARFQKVIMSLYCRKPAGLSRKTSDRSTHILVFAR